MEKIKLYLKELTIVTIGVLIALFLSNLREKNQAAKYHTASIETIKKEIETNYESIAGVKEKHNRLLDTINKHSKDNVAIVQLIQNSGGVQQATLSTAGLDFYTRNKINLIDLDMMSMLITEKSLTELIAAKTERLIDYLYPNLFEDSEESKMLFAVYLRNLMESENQLISLYEDFNEKEH